jgi:hypothetical protein
LAPIDGKPPLGPSGDASKNSENLGRRQRSSNRALSMAPRFKNKNGSGATEGQTKDDASVKATGGRSHSMAKNQVSKKPKLKSYSFISNVDQWLKKNRLPAKTKVFIISNGYQCIKKALKNRGWVQNPNYFSTCFHLKFTLKGSHIRYDGLGHNQVVNHFEKVSVLTTKVGLTKTMN